MNFDGVLGIVLNEKKEILLVKRRDVPLWTLPGGNIKEKEYPIQAIKRELTEETNFKINVSYLAGFGKRKDIEHKKRKGDYLCAFFTCQKISGNFFPNEEITAIKFFKKNMLPRAMLQWHKKIIKNFNSSQKKKININMNFREELISLIFHPLILLRFLIWRLLN